MNVSTGPESSSAHTRRPPTTIDVERRSLEDLSPLERLEAVVVAEMAAAWRTGTPRQAEEWLARHPELAAQPEAAVRIIYEEICLREERGEPVDSADLFRRFPQWRSSLEVLLDCHRLIEPEHTPTFPEVGQQFGDLQLLCELGRGAAGRVFLATQPALSDRPVVVKVTPPGHDEHLSLARLQHTNIVPLYLVQDFPDQHLRALCMPYLGGTSWSRVLEALRTQPPHRRTGRQIVDVLEQIERDTPIAPDFTGPALGFLSRSSYVQAVCWIGACLADALHYAHQRGLVHLDIKPSNVLLAGDGQPMLLDFHLAREMVPAGGGPLDRLGGTRGYMSWEQTLAAAAVREGRPLDVGLNGRSDIYSLGALIYESLAGELPTADEAKSRQRLRQVNPAVTRGLQDLVHKCLAPHPAARYAEAALVATDLRRHLADLPLSGVANRSPRERWQKWRRRRPHAFALAASAALALAVVGGAGLLFHGERLREARLALAQGSQDLERHDYAPAIERFQSGRSAVRWIPGEYDLKQALQTQLAAAERARLADTLHELVERLRFVDSLVLVPMAKLRELDAGCAAIWQARAQIVAFDASAHSENLQRRVRADLVDLALLWADVRVRLASEDQLARAHHDALRTLDEAQALCGSNFVLELARAEHSAALDPAARAAMRPTTEPKSAAEHFALGRSLLKSDQLELAHAQFQRAIELQPDAFWPNFYAALCAYRLEQYDEALNAASVCVALSPKSAECFYNRALAQQALKHDEQATRDFDRALQLDPMLAVASLHRGALAGQQGRYAEAVADLQTALGHGADPAAVWYEMAVVQLARQDRAAALESVKKSLGHDANYAPAAALRSKLEPRP